MSSFIPLTHRRLPPDESARRATEFAAHLDARALVANERVPDARAVLQQLPSLAEQEPGDEVRKREGAELLRTLR
ncbi:hypothetical protein [Gemmatimonas sp.]|jgi:hypothetical protein|uniref:hypothetical protein n=1 Tax=Gemmatimonas sp. TaxID=1962908 RepID=UPI0037BFBCBA